MAITTVPAIQIETWISASSAPIQRRVKAMIKSEQEQRHKAQEIVVSMRRHRRVIPGYRHLEAPDRIHYDQCDASLET